MKKGNSREKKTFCAKCDLLDFCVKKNSYSGYESFATVGEIRVYWRADFQSGSRVLKKVF